VIFGRQDEEPPPEERLGTTSGTTTTTVASPSDSGSRSDEQGGPNEGVILLLFTLITAGAIAWVLISGEHKALHDPNAKADRGEISALDDLSLIRAKNVRKMLAQVRSSSSPEVADLRFAPTSADVTVQNENGDQTIWSFDPKLNVSKNSFGSGSSDDVQPVQAVDPGAPERMVRSAIEKSGRPASDINYVTTSFLTQKRPDWTIAFKTGPTDKRLWIADFHGRDVRRVGTPSVQQRRQTQQTKQNLQKLQQRVKARAKCLSQAPTAQAAARCLKRFPL
jgi:hypothetical protein